MGVEKLLLTCFDGHVLLFYLVKTKAAGINVYMNSSRWVSCHRLEVRHLLAVWRGISPSCFRNQGSIRGLFLEDLCYYSYIPICLCHFQDLEG